MQPRVSESSSLWKGRLVRIIYVGLEGDLEIQRVGADISMPPDLILSSRLPSARSLMREQQSSLAFPVLGISPSQGSLSMCGQLSWLAGILITASLYFNSIRLNKQNQSLLCAGQGARIWEDKT